VAVSRSAGVHPVPQRRALLGAAAGRHLGDPPIQRHPCRVDGQAEQRPRQRVALRLAAPAIEQKEAATPFVARQREPRGQGGGVGAVRQRRSAGRVF
jgi:hypothetical protein